MRLIALILAKRVAATHAAQSAMAGLQSLGNWDSDWSFQNLAGKVF
jgi:hypothetical protein